MKLLAVDQGSHALGLAYFSDDHRLEWTKQLSPTSSWPWLRRMRWIGDAMYELLRKSSTIPDVVAIEDITVHRNAHVALVMGQTRGWLMCDFTAIYPDARIFSINTATVRATVGAPRSREGSKAAYKRAAADLLDVRDVTEDEADACCIGLAAFGELDRERRGIRRPPRPRRRVLQPKPRDPQLRLGAMA